MKLLLYDVKTGRHRMVEDELRPFDWAENNWSCDCNRHQPFGDEGVDNCTSERYLVVWVDEKSYDPDEERGYTLKDYNADYLVKHPDLEKYLP